VKFQVVDDLFFAHLLQCSVQSGPPHNFRRQQAKVCACLAERVGPHRRVGRQQEWQWKLLRLRDAIF